MVGKLATQVRGCSVPEGSKGAGVPGEGSHLSCGHQGGLLEEVALRPARGSRPCGRWLEVICS